MIVRRGQGGGQRPVAEGREGGLLLAREAVLEAHETVPRGEDALGGGERGDRPVGVLRRALQGERQRGPVPGDEVQEGEFPGAGGQRPVAEGREGGLLLAREAVLEAHETVPRGEDALGGGERGDRPFGILRRALERERQRGPVLGDEVHEAELPGAGGRERLARERDVGGGRGRREKLEEDARARLERGEERRGAKYGLVWRAAARDPLIAGEREREARAEGRAVHGREDRPGRPCERPCGPRERVGLRGEAPLPPARDESRKEIRIESSGKGVPQARQDDGRNRRILRERYYRVREHLGHVPREGVPHRRQIG